MLEGATRLFFLPAEEAVEADDWLVLSPELGWHGRPRFRGSLFGTERAFGKDGLLAVDEAALAEGDRTRILLLGDSRMFGNGVALEDTFAEVLDRRLPEAEVINLGVPGYTSFQGVKALELHAARLRPAVVVFAFGFNDRRYVLRAEEADGADHFHLLAHGGAWARFARSLALVRLLQGPTGKSEQVWEQPLDLGTVVPRVSPEAYRRNLEAAVRFCAERRIRLLFLQLHDNPVETRGLVRGLRNWRRGRLDAAERDLAAVVGLGSNFSEAARLYLSRFYEETGRSREAAAVRVSPRTFRSITGGYPILADGEYRAILRAVAAERGVEVVEAGRVLDRRPELYFDLCHFGREGHRAVADALEQALAVRVGSADSPP